MVNENFLGFGVGVGIEPSTFHLGRQGLDMVISAM